MQVRDDPSSRLTELEEDENIKADIPTHRETKKHNSDSVPGSTLWVWVGRKLDTGRAELKGMGV